MPATNNLRTRLSLEERRGLGRNPSISKLNRGLYSFRYRIDNFCNRGGLQILLRRTQTGEAIRDLLANLPLNPSETIRLTTSPVTFRSVIINYVRNDGDADVAIERADESAEKIDDLLQRFPGAGSDSAAASSGRAAANAATLANKCRAPKVWDPITETCV